MALPSPTQVSGKHNAIFEAYYKQVDPKGAGTIQAMDAAKFLKKSSLSDVVLSRIWDLSDPNAKGYLDKPGFFVALKLVSLAQCGQVIKMSNIFYETENPPRVGEIPKPLKMQSVKPNNNDWSVKPGEREKYDNLFQSLKPTNGLLHGNSVKKVLMDSKLPMETLGKIWDLADQDRDGSLDKHEFTIAMHLVYSALEKRAVPEVLPLELQKPKPGVPPPVPPAPAHPPMPKAPSGNFSDGGFVANFPTDIGPPPVPPLPAAIPAPIPPLSSVPPMVPSSIQQSAGVNLISTEPIIPSATAPTTQQPVDWVIIPSELLRYEAMFRESDRDKDGLVSGLEVKGVFLQSGVPQNCLAHIWALCDTHQTGKLTLEQFALAMWMVERKKINIEPPEALTPNMIPPSLRAVVKGVDVVAAEPKPTYSNPELEMISKEIEELSRERRALETDIAQKEADIRIKSGEIRSLQSELDTLMATLKQLENQKGEAQKRLDDLKTQTEKFNEEINRTIDEINVTRYQVNKIREQCQKQEETINEQEGELNTKRSELQKLKDEETALEKEYEANRQELDKLSNQLSYTQLGISQVRASLTQLLELERQMTDALLLCKAAVESQDTHIVSEYSLQIEPDFIEARQILEKTFEPPKEEETKPDPFSATTNDITANSRKISDGFTNQDQVFSSTITNSNNGWGDTDTFHAKFDDGFGNDAFDSKPNSNLTSDPFGDARQTSTSPIPPGKDDFGSDPFAALHAPTGQGKILSPNAQKSGPPPRPESPSPALPPKKSKQPPPRPAPPRPLQGPTRPAPPVQDAFGSTGGGGFADFDDFDNKQPSLPPPPLPLFNNNHNNNNNIFNNNSKSITFTTTTTTTTTTTSSSVTTINALTNINNANINNISNSITSSTNIFTSSPIFNTTSTTKTTTFPTSSFNTSSSINSVTPTTSAYTNTTLNETNTQIKTNNNNTNANTVSNILKHYQRPLTPPKKDKNNDVDDDDDDNNDDDKNKFSANFMELLNQSPIQSNQKQKDTIINTANNIFNNFNSDNIGAMNTELSNITKNNSNSNNNNINNNKYNNNSTIETSSKIISVTSNLPAPTEFADDPFKDYRYEDIFNIKDDPFADEDDDDADDTESSEDPFSSDKTKNSTIIDNSSNNISKSCELIDNFKVTPVSSPVPNQNQNIKQINKYNTTPRPALSISPTTKLSKRTNSTSSRPSSNSDYVADFANFDAFNTNDNTTARTTSNNNKNTDNLFAMDNTFNSSDIFNSNTTQIASDNLTTSNNNTLDKRTNAKALDSANNNNFNADFAENFFENFNDNFITTSELSNTTTTTSATETITKATSNFKANKITSDPFDAFGGGGGGGVGGSETKTTKSSKIFDTNFEDDFFKTGKTTDITNITTTAFTTTTNSNLINNNNNIIHNLTKQTTATTTDHNNLDPFGDSSFNDFANFENVQKTSNNNTKKINFGKNDLKAWSFDSNKKDKKTMLSDTTTTTGVNRININKDNLFDNKKNHQEKLSKVGAASSAASDKVMEKFSQDYSKPDSFDSDFEEAIRRSMIDK